MRCCTWDIEAGNLRADFGSMLVSSIKPLNGKPEVNYVKVLGNDKDLATWTRDKLEEYDLWITFYGKGFDIKFLRTRLAFWGLRDIASRFHIDCYWIAKNSLLTSRKSMAHLAGFFELEEQKFGVSPQVWAKAVAGDKEAMETLVKRCTSDTRVLENLYWKVLPFIKTVTR